MKYNDVRKLKAGGTVTLFYTLSSHREESAYDGFVVWNSGKAMKYYPFDLDTTQRAVMQTYERPSNIRRRGSKSSRVR